MPEILIATINPQYRVGHPERVLKEDKIISLPDQTGNYAIPHLWGREWDEPIHLDLSRIVYQHARWSTRKVHTILYDDYGNNVPGEVTVGRRVSVRSWSVTMTCENVRYSPEDTHPHSSKVAVLGLGGSRTIPMLRNGEARQMLPMLPENPNKSDLPRHRELVVRLKKPVISCYRENGGRWVQQHYYPDYPIMCGTIDSQGNRIEPDVPERVDEYVWVDTLSEREMSWLGTILPKVPDSLRRRIKHRWDQLMDEESRRWRASHPNGNYI